jgi:archaellum component FlaC
MRFTRTTGILMPQIQISSDSKFLYGSLPALPIILGGMVVGWQYGIGLFNVLFCLILVFCGSLCGLFLWRRHINELEQIKVRLTEEEINKINAVTTYTSELERLLLTISPILSQHVMASREHTEQEITSLSSRFSGMVDELRQIVDSTDNVLGGRQDYHLDTVINNSHGLLQPVLDLLGQIHQLERHTVDDATLSQAEANIHQALTILSQALTHYHNDVEALRNNADQIRDEINNVLVALQFQDRVSQILTQVENNLLNLQKTIETIQQQGSDRDSNMLKVDEAVEHIEENYKSVSTPAHRGTDDADDLTFF